MANLFSSNIVGLSSQNPMKPNIIRIALQLFHPPMLALCSALPSAAHLQCPSANPNNDIKHINIKSLP